MDEDAKWAILVVVAVFVTIVVAAIIWRSVELEHIEDMACIESGGEASRSGCFRSE